MKKIILLGLLIMSPLQAAITDNKSVRVTSDILIDGVSDFLVERAEANLIHVFEHKIKDSEEFACYFPHTRDRLKYGHLQEWLLFPKKVFEKTIKKDMEVFALRSVVVNTEQRYKVSKKAAELADKYLELTQDLVVLYNGKRYPLNVTNKNTPEFRVVNGFSKPLGDIISALNVFRTYKTICDSPSQDYAAFNQSIKGLLNIKKKLKAFEAHMKQYGKDLRLSTTKIEAFCEKHELQGDCSSEEKAAKLYAKKVEQTLKKAFLATSLGIFIKQANKLYKKLERDETYTEMVMDILDELHKRKVLDEVDFQRLSRSALFFANICDSDSPKAVKAVLQAYTLPPVSYYSKREYGNHINITSYLGVAHGFGYESDVPEPDIETSIFAPVGLEVSRGMGNGQSLSVMLSPFDFGYPINQRLNGNDEDSKLADILAPSITFSYGFKDLPFTLGGGYQQGRYLPALDKTENRWLVFIAFDMPLWNIR